VLGEITDNDAASGALGAMIGEFTGSILADEIKQALLAGEVTPAQAAQWTNAGVDLSKLAAGLVAAGVGANVDVAADAGGNAVQNNAIFILAGAIAAISTLSATQLALLATGTGAVLRVAYKDKIAADAEDAGAWLKQQLTSLYESLSDEERQQVATMPELIPITLPMASWTPSVAVGSHGLTALPFRQGGFIVYYSPCCGRASEGTRPIRELLLLSQSASMRTASDT